MFTTFLLLFFFYSFFIGRHIDLDSWIDKLFDCKPLPENDVLELCEKVLFISCAGLQLLLLMVYVLVV